MAFTRVWSNGTPGNVKARDLDNWIRDTKLDIDERVSQVLGIATISGKDPLVDGTIVKSIAALVSEINNKATLNPTANTIPKRSGAAFVDSGLVDDGVTATLTRDLVVGTGRVVKSLSLPYAKVYNATPQTVVTGSGVNKILVDTIDGTLQTLSFSSNRVNVPSVSSSPGVYVVYGAIDVTLSVNLKWLQILLRKNGSTIRGGQSYTLTDGSTTFSSAGFSCSVPVVLTGGDYIELFVTLNGTGGSETVSGVLSVHKVM
jgi:hypothetical protein